jgi:sigma-E factor negative regulatory protein RseB
VAAAALLKAFQVRVKEIARPLAAGGLLFAAVLCCGSVRADDDARRWLDDMNRAFSDLSYDGIFSYYSGDDLASLRVVHMVVDGEQRERLVHLNGAPREIVRRGEEVECIVMPGDALLELEQSIPSGPFARAFVRRYDQISDHYGLVISGEDRVADRLAVRLAVMPRDDDRYGYHLWLDKETRLLLRSELLSRDGERLEIFQFNQIRLGDQVEPDALEPDGKNGSLVSHLTLATKRPEPVEAAEMAWMAGWLPPGFRVAAADIRRVPSSLRAVNTMMYTDGLAAFSLFIEDMPESGAAAMVSRNGATVAVTHLIPGSDNQPHLVTLVGEIPVPTAQRIARSVVLRNGQ